MIRIVVIQSGVKAAIMACARFVTATHASAAVTGLATILQQKDVVIGTFPQARLIAH